MPLPVAADIVGAPLAVARSIVLTDARHVGWAEVTAVCGGGGAEHHVDSAAAIATTGDAYTDAVVNAVASVEVGEGESGGGEVRHLKYLFLFTLI